MKKNIRKIIALMLCMLTIVQLSASSVYAVYYQEHSRSTASRVNIAGENIDRWSEPKTSFIYEYNGEYYVVNIAAAMIFVTKYCPRFNKLNEFTMNFELPVWGGFYSGKNYNYMVFGQTNPEESLTKETYRIVKYDKNFKRLGSVSITGKQCQATVPFDAGTVSMAENADGSELTVHTSRERFRSDDGLNHQSQFTVILNTNTMTPINDLQWFQNNHVSHSFNQFVKYDGNTPVLVDHGDAYPRSVVLSKRLANGRYSELDLFTIPGTIGANCTGVNIGGFEVSANNYIVSINSIDHRKVTSYTSFVMNGLGKDERNAVLLISAKSNTDKSKVKQVYLTDYVNKSLHATAPYLVKIDNNQFVAIWKEYKITEETYGSSKVAYYTENAVKYVVVDENGNKLSPIQTLGTYSNLSDCQPIYRNGQIIWYYDKSVTERQICSLAINSKGTHEHPVVYLPAADATCQKEGNIECYYCVSCDKYFSDSYGANPLAVALAKIKKLPHTPGDWKIVTNATATSTGKRIKSCKVCNAVVTEETIPMLATRGDVDMNNTVNSTDALIVLQHSVGKTKLTGERFSRADVDSNSVVNSTDALKILMYTVGKINTL